MSNFNQKWSFPSNNYGEIFGISDSGVETFMGRPFQSLAREICQNSLDAHADNEGPTRIEFSTFEISPTEIPDFETLKDALNQSLDFWSLQTTDKAQSFFKEALHTIDMPTITCLRISDFNTTGLTGSKDEYNSPWSNLIKSSGASDKSGTNGGSFGIGKYAPFACSTLRTVIYSTSDKNGTCAYQGVSRLTSFRNKEGKITQGTGFYGNDRNTPIYEQFSLDPNYCRQDSDHGTDIFILGFKGDASWKDKIIASILDGFLYAVYNQALIVDVEGIEINKSTLSQLVAAHKEYFEEYADEYYEVLTDTTNTKVFEKELTNDPETTGKLSLKLLIKPGFHRRVAMIRQTGMKIKNKGNINGLIPFAGILYIEGDKVNSYLRGLENPQHLEWEVERADDKNKARKFLSMLTKYVKSCLNEMKNDDSAEALDPPVGEYLSSHEEEDVKNQDKVESIQDTIKAISIQTSKTVPRSATIPTNGDNELTTTNDSEGDLEISDTPGDCGSGTGIGKGNGGNGGGHNLGNGSGDSPIDHKKSLSVITPINVRCVVQNKSAGKYTIIFTPSESADEGVMDILMSAESQNYDANIVSVDCPECPDIQAEKNQIKGIIFKKKIPIRLNIQLDYHDYCSLEVKAYGNKI